MVGDQNRIYTMGTSILSRFIECSTQFPNSPAIFVDDRSYTYGELNGLSSAVCALLKAHDSWAGPVSCQSLPTEVGQGDH